VSRRAALAALAFAACATGGKGLAPSPSTAAAPAPPRDRRFLGLPFGKSIADTEADLARLGITARREGPDELIADRCPETALPGPCRLEFGPAGLFAAAVATPVPGAEGVEELLVRLAPALGPATRVGEPEAALEGSGTFSARFGGAAGFGLALEAVASAGAALAVLRAEHEDLAPPQVAGVRLARSRARNEALFEARGIPALEREDEAATVFRRCPQGSEGARACRIDYREGKVAAVTEVYGSFKDGPAALAEWHRRTQALAEEIGVAAGAECPAEGPPPGGDCTASWADPANERLLVVVGAHQNASGLRRGEITVYALWGWPPLLKK
jgi:hypothetical protein